MLDSRVLGMEGDAGTDLGLKEKWSQRSSSLPIFTSVIQSQELARNWSSSLHGRRENEGLEQVELRAQRQEPARK